MFVIGILIGGRHNSGMPHVAPCDGFKTLIAPSDTYLVGNAIISMAAYFPNRIFVLTYLYMSGIAKIFDLVANRTYALLHGDLSRHHGATKKYEKKHTFFHTNLMTKSMPNTLFVLSILLFRNFFVILHAK